MHLNVFETSDQAIESLALLFADTVENTIASKGVCNIVLSGGNSPKGLYELLASPDYREKIQWSKLFFFICDERFVPFDDPASNGLMIKKSLFDPLDIRQHQIFYMNTGMSPEKSAKEYSSRILAHFGDAPLRFDLILLGLGDNAHTASLFPHTQVLHEKSKLVREVFLEDQQAYRITLTAPLINEAARIAFLVLGASKAGAVRSVIEGNRNIEEYPAQLIETEEGEVQWFLDSAAASMLKN